MAKTANSAASIILSFGWLEYTYLSSLLWLLCCNYFVFEADIFWGWNCVNSFEYVWICMRQKHLSLWRESVCVCAFFPQQFFPLWPQLSGQLSSAALFWMALDLSAAIPQEEGQRHCKVIVRSPQELRRSWCCQGRQPGAGPHVFQGEIIYCIILD